jgi:hypothetical protein
MANLHSALKTEVTVRTGAEGVQVLLVRLQHSKDQISHSLHVRPTSFSLSGLQMTDLLAILGFERSACAFVNGECYAKEVDESFDAASFATTLKPMHEAFRQAQRHFENCGFIMDQPEGWDYYVGGGSRLRVSRPSSGGGDGHTAQKIERMKDAEDSAFKFVFTWRLSDRFTGWTIHYRPLHPPLSAEVASIFEFLHLEYFESCPEFNFDSCHWRFIPFEEYEERSSFHRPADRAHAWFDAHKEHFSAGVEHLLATEQKAAQFGMHVLPLCQRSTPVTFAKHAAQSIAGSAVTASMPSQFDVAISFAGTERHLAEKLAQIVRKDGFEVFYDAFYPEHLWGKDLIEFFDHIYRKVSHYCVMFISQEYRDRIWTTHERRSALARALEEKGKEYLLPIEVEKVDIEGLRPTIGRLSLNEYSIEQIAQMLIRKLRSNHQVSA